MANTYESKFKGVEIDDGVNTATYATGTGGINVTIKGTTNVTGTGGRHLEIDGSGKQDKITDQTSLGVGGLKVTGTIQLYQKTGSSGAPLIVSSNNGDFIEAYNGSSYTQIDMLDGNYTNTIFLPTGDGTLATTADITSAINGQSFKTINGESIKGTGDISITAGITGVNILNSDVDSIGTVAKIWFDSKYQEPVLNPTKTMLIMPTPKTKTINGQSILGSGDITIGGGSAGVSSIGGKTGAITLGEGLSMSSQQLTPKVKNIYKDSSNYLCIDTN